MRPSTLLTSLDRTRAGTDPPGDQSRPVAAPIRIYGFRYWMVKVDDGLLRSETAVLAAQVEELQHRLDKDSSTSSTPPSSDGPYRKPRDRSLRASTGRRPGKQPGVRGKAAARLGPFMHRIRDLLRAVPVLYADETPAGWGTNCTTCTWPAPSSSPPCTPGTGRKKR